jgi:cardiolipin synthase C
MKLILFLLVVAWSISSFAGEKLLSELIPYPYHEVNNQSQVKMMTLESGIASLQLRLELIRKAKKNIEVEYFIYNTDMAGKIFTRELVEAAKRGVKVRILIDKSLPIFKFNAYYAKALSEYGIEVRYYNNAPMVRISTVQFRNHRKILSIDDTEAITGGRNIGDDYFDLSHHFNFYDRDVYIKGPIVKTMRKTFDEFFEHKMSERPKLPELKPNSSEKKVKKFHEKLAMVKAFLEESEDELKTRARVEQVGAPLLTKVKLHTCPEATFSSDAPGANFFTRLDPYFDLKYRFLRKTLHDKVTSVDKRIIISSPYLINNDKTRKLMNHLVNKGVQIDLYTNSLASTDAIYVAANLYLGIHFWRQKGINVYLKDGSYLYENEDPEEEHLAKAKWGTHCKSMVYESSAYTEVMIGTYNIDNRSNFYNAEMAVFCKGNDEFSQEIRANILERAYKGIIVHRDGTATDKNGEKRSIYGANENDLFLMRIIQWPSWFLRWLL